MTGRKPAFDREGKTIKGLGYWVGLLAGLGAGGLKGALLRWAVVLMGAYVLTVRR
jgi:beta-apo-4'-carotenal oxygenase